MSGERKFQRFVSRQESSQKVFDIAAGEQPSTFWVRRVEPSGGDSSRPLAAEASTGPDASPARENSVATGGTPGDAFEVSWQAIGHGRVLLRVGGRVRVARIVQSSPQDFLVEIGGRQIPVRADDEITARALRQKTAAGVSAGPVRMLAPMPGTVVNVLVDEGETVAKGQALFVIEAMKMQNELAAPVAGTIQGLEVQAGQAVEARARLCEIAP
jgi:pyruvate carboxylase subunit B